MNVISVIGASGFIGTNLLKQLSQKYSSSEIRVLVHKRNPGLILPNVVFIEGDIITGKGLDQLLASNAVVFNLAYIASATHDQNVQAAKNIVASCIRHKVKRLIHCSTAVVVGKAQSQTINEQTHCNPGSPYEVTKLEVEKTILDAAAQKIEVVVLRPTAVFGAGGKNLLKLSNQITQENGFLNYLRSCIFSTRAMNLVAVDNVIAALMFLAFYEGHIDAEIFIISDDDSDDNNYQYVEQYLMQKFLKHSHRFPVIPIPLFFLRSLLSLLGKPQPNPSVRYEARKIESLGFKKPASLQNGLDSFSQWYISQNKN